VTRSAILGEPINPKQKTDFSIPIVKWSILGWTAVPEEIAAPKKSLFSFWK